MVRNPSVVSLCSFRFVIRTAAREHGLKSKTQLRNMLLAILDRTIVLLDHYSLDRTYCIADSHRAMSRTHPYRQEQAERTGKGGGKGDAGWDSNADYHTLFQFEYAYGSLPRLPPVGTRRDRVLEEMYATPLNDWRPLHPCSARKFMRAVVEGMFDCETGYCEDDPSKIAVRFPDRNLCYFFEGDTVAPQAWSPNVVSHAFFKSSDASAPLICVRNIIQTATVIQVD